MMGSLSRKRDVSLRVDSAPPTSLLRWPFARAASSRSFRSVRIVYVYKRTVAESARIPEMHPAEPGRFSCFLCGAAIKIKTQGAKLVQKPQYPLSIYASVRKYQTRAALSFSCRRLRPGTLRRRFSKFDGLARTNEGRHLEKMSRARNARLSFKLHKNHDFWSHPFPQMFEYICLLIIIVRVFLSDIFKHISKYKFIELAW